MPPNGKICEMLSITPVNLNRSSGCMNICSLLISSQYKNAFYWAWIQFEMHLQIGDSGNDTQAYQFFVLTIGTNSRIPFSNSLPTWSFIAENGFKIAYFYLFIYFLVGTLTKVVSKSARQTLQSSMSKSSKSGHLYILLGWTDVNMRTRNGTIK